MTSKTLYFDESGYTGYNLPYMMTRRDFMGTVGTTSAAGLGLSACAQPAGYEEVAASVWRSPPRREGDDFAYLVHHATLAANTHNTQPWRFSGDGSSVRIAPDLSRGTPVVDPDHHHLYASLGCAAENLAIAAGAAGTAADIAFIEAGGGSVRIDLGGATTGEPALFAAITERQCTRSVYDGRAVDSAVLNALHRAATIDGVNVLLITAKPRIEEVLQQAIAANTAQIDDPGFVQELKSWIRYSEADAIATRDGLYAACSGNPSMPGWIGNLVFGLAFRPGSENDKLARQVRSAAGLAVFVGAIDDAEHWVRAGRSYQRFALQATALGLRHAFINHPVEVPRIRATFARSLGLGAARPDLVIRFGHAHAMPRSLRRRVEDVIAGA